ncbi:MAG: hypothetical protein FD177_115 [Desulfovibrionaceae bacterium]|nr:MAG: hypothetical protein FD177_115 [Desulfovibrionaceae bacterium]
MSLYSLKKAGGGAVQPWSQVITLAQAGKGCDGLFNLYDSLGDKTLTGANTIPTLLDGPEKVVRYGALTLGDGATTTSLTVSNRCKGLTVLCDSLTVKANATLHMTGKGARVDRADDPFFPFIDYKIPFKVSLDSSRMSLVQALAVIKSMGLAPWDAGTFAHIIAGLFGFNLGISLAGSLVLLNWASPGGAGAVPQSVAQANQNGNAGSAGVNGGCGGGGHGGICARIDVSSYPAYHAYSAGKGNPYGGGCGTSGFSAGNGYGSMRDQYDYPRYSSLLGDAQVGGGGAGIPAGLGSNSPWGGAASTNGGEGVGGKLTIICAGAITVQPGGKIEANGMLGGNGPGTYAMGGGGSGGGHLSIITPTAPSNLGTIQAIGGVGGTGHYGAGGAGGAGSVVTKTFSDMGW